jgi:hypothetical protein
MSERLQELPEVRERLDAEVLRLVGSWDRDRAWEIDGALSPRAWLTHRTPASGAEAGRLVENARLVDQQPEVAAALSDGDMTVGHVDGIGRVVSKDWSRCSMSTLGRWWSKPGDCRLVTSRR